MEADQDTGEIIENDWPSDDDEPRDFATEAMEFVTLHRDGTFMYDLGEEVAKIGIAIRELGGKATMTVTFTFDGSVNDGAMTSVLVTDNIAVKLPKRLTEAKLMFVDEDGRMAKRTRNTKHQKLLPGLTD